MQTEKALEVHKISSDWVQNVTFDNQVGNHVVRTDASGGVGDDAGASPKKLLLVALAGCTGVDVGSLLKKMRVPFTSYKMDVEADLSEEHPRVYTEIRLVYHILGENLDRAKVKKAVNLSLERYCGVSAMLQKACPIKYRVDYGDPSEPVTWEVKGAV